MTAKVFLYKEQAESGLWITHLLNFVTMRDALEYADGFRNRKGDYIYTWKIEQADPVKA